MNGHSVILELPRRSSSARWPTSQKCRLALAKSSDQEILAATARVMQRRSPAQLTLADVAKEAGVVPATLIQRFGTKRELLLVACRTAPGSVPKAFAVARARHRSPLKALIELYADGTAFAPTPEAVANGLAYLQIDLTDPDFHAITLAQFRVIRDETRETPQGSRRRR